MATTARSKLPAKAKARAKPEVRAKPKVRVKVSATTRARALTKAQAAARPGASAPAAAVPEHKRLEAIRRATAIAAAKERRERIAEYHRAYAALERASRPTRGVATRRAGVAAGRAGGPGAPAPAKAPPPLRLVAEGDSWFDYPPHLGIEGTGGVITELAGRLDIPILNLAKAGDEARYMLGEQQRRRIRKLFTDPATPHAFFFSGGGNDVAGEPLVLWIRDRKAGMKPADAVDPKRYGAVLDLTMSAYEDLRAMRDAHAPQCVLFLHSYDYAVPNGKGVCGLGPWLEPSLEARGWKDYAEAKAIVKALLTAFRLRLEAFASADPEGTVLVPTQGLLTEDQWDNELHPTRKGFRVVARAFEEAVRARLVIPAAKPAAPKPRVGPPTKAVRRARAPA
jgi:hypothetical protein